MTGVQQAPEPPRAKPFQFSLLALFGVITICALAFSLFAWKGFDGLFTCMICWGLCLLVAGIYRKRVSEVGLGLVVSVMSTAMLSPTTSVGHGTGTYVLPVAVVDAATDEPISGAKVFFFRSAGRVAEPELEPARTGADGSVNITAKFRVDSCTRKYSSGRTEREETVRLSGNLKVVAEGYAPVRLKLSDKVTREGEVGQDFPLPPVTIEMRRK